MAAREIVLSGGGRSIEATWAGGCPAWLTYDLLCELSGQRGWGARAMIELIVAPSPLHLDVDVLDPAVMTAVDSPAPGGLQPEQLAAMLSLLVPGAVGAQMTVLDPDLDPDGSCTATVGRIVIEGLGQLGSQRTTPDHPGTSCLSAVQR